MPTAVVVGVGPGLGGAVARRFARGGFDVALMARDAGKLPSFAKEVAAEGRRAASIAVDATDAASVAAGFARARAELGPASVLVYNAGAFAMGSILDITPEDFDRCFRANCTGGFLTARAVLPDMLKEGRGTILLTGATASLRGSARFACLAVGKFGLRALAQSMARELQPKGIHVAHVVIDGQIDGPRYGGGGGGGGGGDGTGRDKRTLLAPDAIAETYWHLHAQDPTSWTHELDVRPMTEKF